MAHGYQTATIDSVAWLGLEASARRADGRRLQLVVAQPIPAAGAVPQILLIALQVVQVIFLWIHDWIPLGRMNDHQQAREAQRKRNTQHPRPRPNRIFRINPASNDGTENSAGKASATISAT